jgi:protein-tyrosine-phosphatase/DNA-binding transcriptional ArsR family regulator
MLTATNPSALASLLANPVRWKLILWLINSDYSVSELEKRLKKKQNLISYHLRRLQNSKLVKQVVSKADARESYYSLDVSALRKLFFALGDTMHPALNPSQEEPRELTQANKPVRVLFLCTHNSARSQMAEGLMRAKGGDRVHVVSAGTEPSQVHPLAIAAMEKLNVDIRSHHSKSVTEFIHEKFDYVITVCDRAKESCPIFPGAPEQIHWSFPDPSEVSGAEAEKAKAFDDTAIQLSQRINFLLMAIQRSS